MVHHKQRFSTFALPSFALALVTLIAPVAPAASINYGDFGPIAPGISFLQVIESSGTDGVPLYDVPAAFVTGLDFNPAGFVASATAGAADITDGQLNFTIIGQENGGNGVAIGQVSLSESGIYNLFGVGTAASQVAVGASMRVKITEIDGVAVTPISMFANSSVTRDLVANPAIGGPWSLGLVADLQAQLNLLAIPYTLGVTRADVVIDNSLIAISEAASTASIHKTDFAISIVPHLEIVPEPTTWALAGVACCGIGLARRRRLGS